MPKNRQTVSGDYPVRSPSKNMLDESNPMSYIPDGRNVQADYYRLQNRDKQLEAIKNLTDDEVKYILNDPRATAANGKAEVAKAVQRIHEKDLVELRALVYLQSLPDTSPEYLSLKSWSGCESREQIAAQIAEKSIKKLMMSQVEAIAGGADLTSVYKATITKGADAFKGLFR